MDYDKFSAISDFIFGVISVISSVISVISNKVYEISGSGELLGRSANATCDLTSNWTWIHKQCGFLCTMQLHNLAGFAKFCIYKINVQLWWNIAKI